MKPTLIKDAATVKRNPQPSSSELAERLEIGSINSVDLTIVDLTTVDLTTVDLTTDECDGNSEMRKEGEPPVISRMKARVSLAKCQPRYTYESQTQPDLPTNRKTSKPESEDYLRSSTESSRMQAADPTEHGDTQMLCYGQGKVEDLFTFLGDSIDFI